MFKFIIITVFSVLLSTNLMAQVDTTFRSDTLDTIASDNEIISNADSNKTNESIILEIKDQQLTEEVNKVFANIISKHTILHPSAELKYTIERTRHKRSYNFEFLLILGLIFIPAIFKVVNPSYFRNIFIAFRKPNLSARSLKDQLSQNSLASFVMDVFSCLSIGVFIFSSVQYFQIQLNNIFTNKYLLCFSIVGGLSIYFLLKFILLKLQGYIFNIHEITETYTFNISLINKIIGVVLLPFTAIILLNDAAWIQSIIFIALIISGIMIFNAYYRSAILFKYFLNHSIFHFFLYLCTSEIIPLLIIYALINNAMA